MFSQFACVGGGDASYGRENSGIPYFKCLKSNIYTKILPQCSAQSGGWILTCIQYYNYS